MSGIFTDLLGTVRTKLRIGIAGVTLKDSSGNLVVRNAADGADAEVTASKVNVSGDVLALDSDGTAVNLKASGGNIAVRNSADNADAELTAAKVSVSGDQVVINSDSAGAGDDWKVTLTRAATGMTADVTLTLPPNDGSAGQLLQTDGNGNMAWVTSAQGEIEALAVEAITASTAGPMLLADVAAGRTIEYVDVIVDATFDGDFPALTVGVTGVQDKYVAANQISLKEANGTLFRIPVTDVALISGEAINVYYTDDVTTTVGSARVIIRYGTQSDQV